MNWDSVQRMGKRIPWRPIQKNKPAMTLAKLFLALLE